MQYRESHGRLRHTARGGFCGVALVALLVGSSTAAQGEVEMAKGRFSPCPDTPNCVSSKETETDRYIDPLQYEGDSNEARVRLISIINGMKRAEVVEDTGTYIHATFKSWLFHFVDDVEFQIDDDDKVIHIRSASRVGYYDLGVNRRRCESIREKFDR